LSENQCHCSQPPSKLIVGRGGQGGGVELSGLLKEGEVLTTVQ